MVISRCDRQQVRTVYVERFQECCSAFHRGIECRLPAVQVVETASSAERNGRER
jgi:hypothetical protein